jgi:hypothetical protein
MICACKSQLDMIKVRRMLAVVSQNRSWIIVTVRLIFIAGVFFTASGGMSFTNARNLRIHPALTILVPQENGWTALKTDDGILFIWNREGLHFTLSIKGNDIRPMNDPDHIFFVVDGLVFQIQSLPISNFAPEAKKKKLDDKAILLAHQEWESKFIEGMLGTKLTVQSAGEKLRNGGDVLLWGFDVPKELASDAKKQMYLTVVSKDYVILLNGVVNERASEPIVRKFLLDTIATLKLSPDRIEVKKLQESIRKSRQP